MADARDDPDIGVVILTGEGPCSAIWVPGKRDDWGQCDSQMDPEGNVSMAHEGHQAQCMAWQSHGELRVQLNWR